MGIWTLVIKTKNFIQLIQSDDRFMFITGTEIKTVSYQRIQALAL